MAWEKGQSGNPSGRKASKPITDAIHLELNRLQKDLSDNNQTKKRCQVLAKRIVDDAIGDKGQDASVVRQAREILTGMESMSRGSVAITDPGGEPLGVGVVHAMQAAFERARERVAGLNAPIIEGEVVGEQEMCRVLPGKTEES